MCRPCHFTVSPQHQPTSNSSLVSLSASIDEGGQNNIQHGPTPASNIDSTRQKNGRGLTTGKLIEKMIRANVTKNFSFKIHTNDTVRPFRGLAQNKSKSK
ncbi:hypothetical protein ACH5RR_013207 [Cinchona calisaya]|uniref:Uncharacterized protein n=1 Tax=Cinchona calisaya TaxID=153742 RepID=A0ABD3A2S5_9GENT